MSDRQVHRLPIAHRQIKIIDHLSSLFLTLICAWKVIIYL
jgi:hypothetical protein